MPSCADPTFTARTYVGMFVRFMTRYLEMRLGDRTYTWGVAALLLCAAFGHESVALEGRHKGVCFVAGPERPSDAAFDAAFAE